MNFYEIFFGRSGFLTEVIFRKNYITEYQTYRIIGNGIIPILCW